MHNNKPGRRNFLKLAGAAISLGSIMPLDVFSPVASVSTSGWGFDAPSLFAQVPTSPDSSASDQVTRAVVQLLAIGPGERSKNRECAATGFFVNEEGYLLTNAHVFEDAKRCLGSSPGAKILARISTPGSDRAMAVSCDLVGLDDVHDLAVMKTERALRADPAGEPLQHLKLDPSDVVESTRVAVTGHPEFTWHPVTQTGKVTRRMNLPLSEVSKEFTEVLVLDILLRPGNSGSPVYLPAAGVVGVVERRNPLHPSETLAVSIRHAIELLNRLGVRWHAGRK